MKWEIIFSNVPEKCKIPKWVVDKLTEWNNLTPRKKTPKLRKREITEVIGFDTETVDGYCRLICSSDGNFSFTSSFDDIIAFLTNRKYAKTLNLFWNVDYDFFAIVKYLPKIYLETLYYKKQLTINGITVKWLPKKAFIIKKNKRNYYFFDLYQYFHCSLDYAGKKYLGTGKLEDVDRENIAKYFENPELRTKLIEYCMKDCEITARLGQLLKDKFEQLGLDFSKPFSCGSISLQSFSSEIKHITFKPTFYNLYAYLSYFGGRFELLKRGYVDYVYCYDINSAYPHKLANLLDITKGEWIYVKNDYNPEARYGFYKCIVTVEDDCLSPFIVKEKGLVYYPNTQSTLTFLTKEELELALKYFDCEVEVIDGWEFYPAKIVYPFAKIREIYEERKKIKHTDPILQLTYKIIMNALYGKTAERVAKWVKTDGEDWDVEVIEGNDIVRLKKTLENGRFFNPVYASLITAQTRVQLLEKALKHPKNIVALFTDCIVTTKPFIETSKELGAWSLDFEGEGLFLLCGVYEIVNWNSEVPKRKTRFRGFKIKENFSLIEWIKQNPDEKSLIHAFKKALKLGEVITHHRVYDIKDLNLFIDLEKQLHIDAERKRDWEYKPEFFGELLDLCIESHPLYY